MILAANRPTGLSVISVLCEYEPPRMTLTIHFTPRVGRCIALPSSLRSFAIETSAYSFSWQGGGRGVVRHACQLSDTAGMQLNAECAVKHNAQYRRCFATCFASFTSNITKQSVITKAIFTNREPANGPIRTFSLHVHLRPPRTSTERL